MIQSLTIDGENVATTTVLPVYGADEGGTWSANGLSMVVGGRRLHIMDAIDRRPKEAPPAAVCYNDVSLTVASSHHRDIKVWDVVTGALMRTFEGLTTAEITSMCFDSRQRKLIVSDQSGAVTVFNYLNGIAMLELPSHESEVAAIAYNAVDDCVVSVGWDRDLRVYDSQETGEDAPAGATDVGLLRVVKDAHATDITTVEISTDLSLVATAGRDGSLRVWDFQFMTIDAEITMPMPITATAPNSRASSRAASRPTSKERGSVLLEAPQGGGAISLGSRSVGSQSPTLNAAGSLDGSLASSLSVQSTGVPVELASAAEAEALAPPIVTSIVFIEPYPLLITGMCGLVGATSSRGVVGGGRRW